MFGGSYAPVQWAFCNSQILAISQNDALSSLISTTYGGDGIKTFALPDLGGRIPVHQGGTGPGLSNRRMGEHGGLENAYLNLTQLPPHTHAFMANSVSADSQTIQKVLAKTVEEDKFYSPGEPASDVDLIGGSIGQTGGNKGHYNMIPYSCINFIIATAGTYPSRT